MFAGRVETVRTTMVVAGRGSRRVSRCMGRESDAATERHVATAADDENAGEAANCSLTIV